jgi:hypothetical protein
LARLEGLWPRSLPMGQHISIQYAVRFVLSAASLLRAWFAGLVAPLRFVETLPLTPGVGALTWGAA